MVFEYVMFNKACFVQKPQVCMIILKGSKGEIILSFNENWSIVFEEERIVVLGKRLVGVPNDFLQVPPAFATLQLQGSISIFKLSLVYHA